MEDLQKAFRAVVSMAQESTTKLSVASSLEKIKSNQSTSSSTAASMPNSNLLVTRPPRQFVSLWTCSKLCAVFFVAGILVGYTLKRRVNRWVSKLLKKIKD